jgi:hypothetical protein
MDLFRLEYGLQGAVGLHWVFGGIERGSGNTFLVHREKLVSVTVHHKSS